MNHLPRLSRLSSHLHQYRIVKSNGISSSLAYSICCTQRVNVIDRWHHPVSAGSVCYMPKRHKSFTESISDIYMAVSNSTTVSYFQNCLISFHDITGLPWWATIIIYTIGLRMLTFPLAIYAQKIKAHLHSILQIEMPAMNDELKREVAIAKKKFNLSDKDAYFLYKKSFNTQYRKMIERDNCHPMKTTILFWFQIPIWICHSIGIRNIITMRPDPNSYKAFVAFTQMSVGGFLWVPNLIEIDSSYILPVLWCITNLINIELSALEKDGKPSKMMIIMSNLFRGITIAIVPIAASVPSCLALYWCTSSLCALAQNLFLVSPKAKRTFGIPLNTKYHMDHPYRTMAHRFNERMEQRKNWCLSFIKSK